MAFLQERKIFLNFNEIYAGAFSSSASSLETKIPGFFLNQVQVFMQRYTKMQEYIIFYFPEHVSISSYFYHNTNIIHFTNWLLLLNIMIRNPTYRIDEILIKLILAKTHTLKINEKNSK